MNNSNTGWSQKIAAQYDSLYEADEYYRGVESLTVVREIAKACQGGRVLDIGGGEGRHALYLARLGFVVDVVDLSSVGLKKIRNVAATEKLHINTICADIAKLDHSQQYDVVIVSFVLHHLLQTDAVAVLESAQNATLPGGVQVFAGFSDEGQLYERAKKAGRFYPSQEGLKSIYAGWKITWLKQKETTTMARDKTGMPLKNQLLEIVVEKSD